MQNTYIVKAVHLYNTLIRLIFTRLNFASLKTGIGFIFASQDFSWIYFRELMILRAFVK